mgnify:CR=1 FL=1
MKINKDLVISDTNLSLNQVKTNTNNILNLQGYVLYSNSSGSNETITLNDSISNYSYIDVIYRNNDQYYTSRRFFEPSEKKLMLDSYYISSGATNIVFKFNEIKISGKTVTRTQFGECSKNYMTSNQTGTNTYIIKIIGYK